MRSLTLKLVLAFILVGLIGAGLVALLVRAVDDGALRGAFNGTAPNPVTNKEFTRTLGRVLHRPTVLPLPPLALRLRFGEAASVLTAQAAEKIAK